MSYLKRSFGSRTSVCRSDIEIFTFDEDLGKISRARYGSCRYIDLDFKMIQWHKTKTKCNLWVCIKSSKILLSVKTIVQNYYLDKIIFLFSFSKSFWRTSWSAVSMERECFRYHREWLTPLLKALVQQGMVKNAWRWK